MLIKYQRTVIIFTKSTVPFKSVGSVFKENLYLKKKKKTESFQIIYVLVYFVFIKEY